MSLLSDLWTFCVSFASAPPLGANDGPVRPEDYPHREGCVRDKWEAQKPTTALASGLNRRILAWSGTRTTAVFARKTSLYLFSAKSTDRSLRLASRSPRNAARKVRILACSGTRTTDSPRARSGRLHSLVLAAPAQRGPEVVPAKATCGWFWYF